MKNMKLIEKYIIENHNKIKINSKDISKGDVFLALKGNNVHGNKFIKSSIENGAKYCLTDKKIQSKKNNIDKIFYVNDTINFLINLAKKKRKLYKGKVIGITGSAGKTTLKETLSFFLRKKYNVSASQKSYNNLLGVIISLLNSDIKSKFFIFELGTNNFGEIENLVKLILPTQVFLTNIQSTHLENFKNKKNIAFEKSNIFNPKFNTKIKLLIFQNKNKEESLLLNIAKKYKIKKIISLGETEKNNCFISSITKKQKNYLIEVVVNKKKFILQSKNNFIHRINNIIFCLALFDYNKLDTKIIIKNINKVKPVIGRGLIVEKIINKKRIIFIDETYNANPDTMAQSIDYFNSMNSGDFDKFLILGDMNELGKYSKNLHLNLLKNVEKYKFHTVILCGEFLELAIMKIKRPLNKYVIKKNEKDLIRFIKSKIHKNAMILAKCSNSTNVNKFALKFAKMKGDN
tara:strand:+ start:102 stop:1484 length:1383 start_codon:yes stop_codon:yes gene_type:complete